MSACIFCKIAAGEATADVVLEGEDFVAFRDINPMAPVHILVIPKHHYDNLDELADDNPEAAGKLLLAVKTAAEKAGVSGGYRVVTNCGKAAGQVVPHLHFHVMAGREFSL